MKQTPNEKNQTRELKASLKARKVKQLTIAKMLNVHPVCVSEVINGRRKNPRVRKAIALFLGKEVNQIDWPENKKNTPAPADRQKTGCR